RRPPSADRTGPPSRLLAGPAAGPDVSRIDGGRAAVALQAGAKGYLIKDCHVEELASAIRSVNNGYSQFAPGLLEKMIPTVPDNSTIPEPELLVILKNFNPETLLEMVDSTVSEGRVNQLLTRLSHHLNEYPTNLAALYLTGTLTHKRQGDKVSAFDYLELGFREGIKQGLPCDSLVLFYREGSILRPEDALTWLVQVDSPWNSESGLPFVLEETAQVFGKDSSQYQSLLILKWLRAMAKLSDACNTVTPKLEVLHRGFDRLIQTLKL
ncbi:MAG: hypothetical protein F6K10_22510, partial [Moorea sp. SIO2B7]|nr:hypothetical protein [Moorena sp. SIO2B7]